MQKLYAIPYTLNAMNKLYGLIFDVDGVITDTEAVNARVSIKVFADLFGIEGVTREDFEAGLGRGAEEYVKAGARSQKSERHLSSVHSSDVDDFYPGELAVRFERKFQVAVYEQLVEALCVACVGYVVQFKLDRSSAAARRQSTRTCQETTTIQYKGAARRGSAPPRRAGFGAGSVTLSCEPSLNVMYRNLYFRTGFTRLGERPSRSRTG